MSFTELMRRPAAARAFRPTLDVLEDRTVPASLGTMNLPLDVSNLHVVTATDGSQTLQGVVNLAGQQAGTLTADLTTQAAPAGQTPILDLHLNALHLNLLGLHVDTSNICLDVSSTGQGLLGGLLSDLSGGLNLGGILGQVNNLVGGVNNFLGQIDSLLDNVLGQTLNVDSVFSGGGMASAQQAGHVCDVLNLSLGPVNLNLLGVNVDLDNCADGPVTVDVTAHQGEGLLGNLLCGLSDGLSGINPAQLIGRIDNLIDRLGTLAGKLDQVANAPQLVQRLEHITDQLTQQLEHLADKVDNVADLGRFLDRVDRTIDRVDNLIGRLP